MKLNEKLGIFGMGLSLILILTLIANEMDVPPFLLSLDGILYIIAGILFCIKDIFI